MTRPLPCPEHQRQLPRQFSWIDQRLARHHYFPRASSPVWALYLFLLTVADAQGLSYYSERRLCQQLRFDHERLARARQALIRLQLLAYQRPLYQVLALPAQPPLATPPPARARRLSEHAHQQLQQLRQQLRGQRR